MQTRPTNVDLSCGRLPQRPYAVAAILAMSFVVGCGDAERGPFIGGAGLGSGDVTAAGGGAPSDHEAGAAVTPGTIQGGVVRSMSSLFDDPAVRPLHRHRVTIEAFTPTGLRGAVRVLTGAFQFAPALAGPVWLRASIGGDKGAGVVVSVSAVGPDEAGRMIVPIYPYDAVSALAETVRADVPANAGALVLRFVGRDGSPRAGVSVEPIAGAFGPIARTLSGGVQRATASGSDGFVVFLAPPSSGMVAYTIGTARRTIFARVELPAVSLLVVTTE